jgi:hypothetical protein
VRILCCYTFIHPRTVESLRLHAPGTEFVGVVGDDFAYWREIKSRWNGEDSLTIIEHDIEIHEDVIGQFRSCPEPWCAFPYEVLARGNWLDQGIGCTKFSAELQRLVPAEEIESVPASCWRCPGRPDCWSHIDSRISQTMAAHGITVHRHGPPYVRHYNKALISV